jgi:hypothetical protein
MNNQQIEQNEKRGERRLWWHVETWLLLVFFLLLIAAIANWRALN